MPDWQQHLAWPADTVRLAALGEEIGERYLAFASSLGDVFEQRLVVVAGPNLIGRAMTLIEAALVVQGERSQGVRMVGIPPEIDLMRGGEGVGEVRDPGYSRPVIFGVRPIKRPQLRRIARTASWTPWAQLPGALVRPQATAVSHNSNLRGYAAAAPTRLDFRHGDWLLGRIRRRPGGAVPGGMIPALSGALTDALTAEAGIEEPFLGRLRDILLPRVEAVLQQMAVDAKAMEASAEVPAHTWSGTSGYYPTRMLSAEVRRRGGTHTGFDHGGTTGISELMPTTALVELSTTSTFFLGTQAMADGLTRGGAPGLVSGFNSPQVAGLDGDPAFKPFCLDRRAPVGKRRRALYPTVRFRGYRQYAMVDPPDPIYLDFQLRLAQALVDMGLDLTCKPHPEGVWLPGPHPLGRIAPTSAGGFEAHLQEADVFIFDSLNSTVFGQACCTDRPVVFIDYGCSHFNPPVEAILRRRMRTVSGWFDDAGRIQFDVEQLREAAQGGDDRADPTESRNLWAGMDD